MNTEQPLRPTQYSTVCDWTGLDWTTHWSPCHTGLPTDQKNCNNIR
jgi:hypothetical protein